MLSLDEITIALSKLVTTSSSESSPLLLLSASIAVNVVLAIVLIGLVSSYATSSSPSLSSKTTTLWSNPASTDKSVGFDVLSNLPDDDTALFKIMLDQICKELVEELPVMYGLPKEACSWIERMLKYTVDGGKMNRGLSLVTACKAFSNSKGHQEIDSKKRCQIAALGWCVEVLQAFFLVADDIMDGSETRRGQPCWYRLDDVNMIAVNDSLILESFVYKILKKYFSDEVYYFQLVDMFLEVTRQTEYGQLLDLTSQPLNGSIDFSRFTMERYVSIVKYKTSFYSFYLPVACGMILAGITDPVLYDQAREILLVMGEYFQIQDDYLDCFGAPEVIGKIGTDIQDNKCSWLVIQALQLVDAKQRKVLEDNYGRHDMRKVNKVKKVYQDIRVEEVFQAYEEQSHARIQLLMKEVRSMPTDAFDFLLKKIYKRSK